MLAYIHTNTHHNIHTSIPYIHYTCIQTIGWQNFGSSSLLAEQTDKTRTLSSHILNLNSLLSSLSHIQDFTFQHIPPSCTYIVLAETDVCPNLTTINLSGRLEGEYTYIHTHTYIPTYIHTHRSKGIIATFIQ